MDFCDCCDNRNSFISGYINQITQPPTTISSVIISKVYANGFCLGGCVNNLTITSDGAVKYYERTGDTYHAQKEGKISEQQLSKLVQLFNNNNFFSLNERYDCENAPTDAGGNTFSFKDDSREKSVWVYGGCEIPSQLRPINEELNKILLNIISLVALSFIRAAITLFVSMIIFI